MKPRLALIIAAVLTTFILVLVGAVATRLVQPSPAEQAAAIDGNLAAPVAVAAPSEPSPIISPTIVLGDALAARDAAYQQQLAEAQARIEQANRQLQQVYD